jgi:hypothetical protein
MKSMFFSNNNNNNTITYANFPNKISANNHYSNQKNMLTLSQKTVTFPNPPSFINSMNSSKPSSQTSESKKLLWGEPIWFFFHTMAHKVKDQSFEYIRSGFLQTIYSICSYLPCPACSKHAVEYLNGINFMTIKTKTDLKNVLFSFHNSVNERKRVSLFPYEDLDSKYDKANTVNIVNNFMIVFLEKSKNTKMMANDFHKNRVISQLKDWLNTNLVHFDP